MALNSNDTVVVWGDNGSGQTNVPAGLTNIIAIAAGSEWAHLDTAPMQYRGKRSADLRIGTNRRFPAALPNRISALRGQCQDAPDQISDFGIEFALAIPRQEHTLAVRHQSKSHYETGVVG
jgi:hypothetical protein